MNYATSSGKYRQDRYNMNQHKDYEIIYYCSGSGKLNVGEKFFSVEQGTIVVVPPNTKHGSISLDNLAYISILGNPNGLIHVESPVICKDNERGDGLSLLKIIQANRFGDPEYFNSLCTSFIHLVLKNIKINSPMEKAVNKIKSQISSHLNDSNFNVTALLNQSGYAEDYIRAHFRKIVGKTPVEFLTELRIKEATTLIKLYHNTMSLMEIANSCGFDDYIYFSRKFKSVMGVSPQSYKNSLLKDNS